MPANPDTDTHHQAKLITTSTANGTNYQLRVTLATGAANVYTVLNKFVLYVSTNGSNNCTVTIDKALESTPTTYTNVATDVPLSG